MTTPSTIKTNAAQNTNTEVIEQPKKKQDSRTIGKVKCIALTYKEKPCRFYKTANSEYCDAHSYYNSYTEYQRANVQNCFGCQSKKYIEPNNNKCASCTKNRSEQYQKVIEINKSNKCEALLVLSENKPCPRNRVDDHYCKFHAYIYDYTDDEQKLIKMKHDSVKQCGRCGRVHFRNVNKCQNCTDESFNAKKPSIRCNGTERTGNSCITKPINDTDYCRFHQYMVGYTQEQIDNVLLCSDCKMYKYLDGNKTCGECRTRSKENKLKSAYIKENKQQCLANKPSGERCGRYALEDNGGYCGKHTAQKIKHELEQNGSNVCSNFNRGCRTILESNEFKKCEECRKTEREQDTKRRHEKDAIIRNQLNDLQSKGNNINDIDKVLTCTKCNKSKPANTFRTSRGEFSKKCGSCLERQRVKEERRDRTGRDYSSYEKTEERIKAKKEWLLSNPEKPSLYTFTYRQKKINSVGINEFRKQQAQNAILWRQNNPHRLRDIYNRDRVNIDSKIYTYKRSAKDNNRVFELTNDQIVGFFMDDCYYCGEEPIIGVNLNGIDRKNNNLGYTLDNCVTACTTCNYMKSSIWDENQFIFVAEHILTIHNFIEGSYHPELFRDHISDYYQLECSAITRNINFKLTSEEYDELHSTPCYICHKPNSKTNINGVDRVDNDLCYIFYNCQPCCGDCNEMKKNFSFDLVLYKLLQIYAYHNNECDITDIEFEKVYSEVWKTIRFDYDDKQSVIDKAYNTDKITKVGGKNGFASDFLIKYPYIQRLISYIQRFIKYLKFYMLQRNLF